MNLLMPDCARRPRREGEHLSETPLPRLTPHRRANPFGSDPPSRRPRLASRDRAARLSARRRFRALLPLARHVGLFGLDRGGGGRRLGRARRGLRRGLGPRPSPPPGAARPGPHAADRPAHVRAPSRRARLPPRARAGAGPRPARRRLGRRDSDDFADAEAFEEESVSADSAGSSPPSAAANLSPEGPPRRGRIGRTRGRVPLRLFRRRRGRAAARGDAPARQRLPLAAQPLENRPLVHPRRRLLLGPRRVISAGVILRRRAQASRPPRPPRRGPREARRADRPREAPGAATRRRGRGSPASARLLGVSPRREAKPRRRLGPDDREAPRVEPRGAVPRGGERSEARRRGARGGAPAPPHAGGGEGGVPATHAAPRRRRGGRAARGDRNSRARPRTSARRSRRTSRRASPRAPRGDPRRDHPWEGRMDPEEVPREKSGARIAAAAAVRRRLRASSRRAPAASGATRSSAGSGPRTASAPRRRRSWGSGGVPMGVPMGVPRR